MSSLQRFEGYLLTDHSNGPGCPEMGYPGGVKVEEKTMWCSHCSAVVILNPERVRTREYCRKCDNYICDNCASAAALPDYVHRSIKEICDLVQSGKYTLTGSLSNPVLIPT